MTTTATSDTADPAEETIVPPGLRFGPRLPAPAERAATGLAARAAMPLEAHAEVTLAADRDVVGLLLGQGADRVPELVPVRHGRMLVSPFTFYRGAALPMAADLGAGPSSGLRSQLCGDAHLSNFGGYASAERRMVFDINDFDETLPGPFEWDVKRLAASLVVAARDNGLSAKGARKVARAAAENYRHTMARFARMSMLDVWYAVLDVERELADSHFTIPKGAAKRTRTNVAKARSRTSMQALKKLTTLVDGVPGFIHEPPVMIPIESAMGGTDLEAAYGVVRQLLDGYRATLATGRDSLLAQFELIQVARRVVGVGSVGTEAWVLLLVSDRRDPLVLQAKEAKRSVLADYAGDSEFDLQGQRVVTGQHLMQSSSDIFLGYARNEHGYRTGGVMDYYLRQLRDWKLSPSIETMTPEYLLAYGRVCAWVLARAHARSGDRVAISAYLGEDHDEGKAFDKAIATFAEAYADQNERDYAAFAAAAEDGRVPVESGI